MPISQKDTCRTALLLADLHAGSAYAPWPKKFRRSTGHTVQLNAGQRYLSRCWDDFLERIPKQLDYLILDGDMIEGQQPKQMARDLVDVDPQWQARAAKNLLEPLAARATEVRCTMGTDYHGGEQATWEEWIACQLGAVQDDWGHHAADWLLLNIDGVQLDIAHSQSTAINTSMPLERELRYALMIDDERPDIDMIVRAHTHNYRWLVLDGRITCGLPAWKLQGRHVRRSKTPNRFYSRLLGALLLRIYPGRKRRNTVNREGFIEHEAFTYRHPPLKPSKGGVR